MNTKLPRAPQRTTPGFAFSMIERSLFDCLGERRFGKAEMQEVLAFFGGDPPECVFCGSREVKRWDHLVPIRHGGETVLGNMVPSCAACDDSKQHVHLEEWMNSDAKYSPKTRGVSDLEQRVQCIKAYTETYGYEPRSLQERLTQDEQERLAKIRTNLRDLRAEVETLIKGYRARTGYN